MNLTQILLLFGSTITRQIGDKSHTVTTVKRPDGTEERTETTNNPEMENEDWRSPRRPWIEDRPQIRGQRGDDLWTRERNTTSSLFDKFFGDGK